MDNFTSNLFSSPYVDMLMYSMHDIGDLGSYEGCNSLGLHARYYVLMLNITQQTAKIRSGLCLPRPCTPADLNALGDMTSAAILGLMRKVGDYVDLVRKYDLTVQVSFTSEEQYEEDIKEQYQEAAVLYGVFLGLFLIMVVVATTYDRL